MVGDDRAVLFWAGALGVAAGIMTVGLLRALKRPCGCHDAAEDVAVDAG